MSIPSYVGANVEIAQHTFSHLISRTNQLIYDMGTVVLTAGAVAQPNTINGALTSGNALLQGVFGSTDVVISGTLRGGNHTTPAALSITSNTNISASMSVTGPNIVLGSANTALININAELGSNIVPRANNSVRIGASDRVLNYLYSNNVRAETQVLSNRLVALGNATGITIDAVRTGAASSVILRSYDAAGVASDIISTPSTFRPSSNNAIQLGIESGRWSALHTQTANVYGDVRINGTTTVGSNILSSNTATVNIFGGTSTVNIANTANTISLGTNTTTPVSILIGNSAAANTTILTRGTNLTLATNVLTAASTINIGNSGNWLGTLNLGRPGSLLRSLANAESTSVSTGSAVFSGGVGIAKRLNVAGNTAITGALAVTGNTTVSNLSGATFDFTGSGRVRGNLTVDGDLVLTNSNIEISVSSSVANDMTVANTFTLSGRANSHIIPSTTNTFDIGSDTLAWRNVYAQRAFIRSNGGGFAQIRHNNGSTANTTIDLPTGNVTLRTGSVAVLTDKFTAMANVTAAELAASVIGTRGTGDLVFHSDPVLVRPEIASDMFLRNGTNVNRVATITNNATSNTTIVLPTASGTLARTADLGTGTLTISGTNGISASGSFGANDNSNTTINITNSDRGSSQNIFKNIQNSSGTTEFSAENNNDYLRFIAGSGMSVTFAAANKSITFSSNMTAGDGISIASNSTVSVDATVVRTSRTLTAGDGLTGGGNLSANRTFAVDSTVVRTSITLSAGWGISGGGNLSANRSFSVNQTELDTRYALNTVSAIAGDGLTGGGNLGSNFTFAVDATVVRTTGNQTIAGIKTFSGSQIIMSSPSEAQATPSIQFANGVGIGYNTSGDSNLSLITGGVRRLIVDSENNRLTLHSTFSYYGNGSGITALNGSAVTTGTVADARLPATIVRTSITLTAGDGLTGGGNLSANRSFAVDSTVVRTSGDQDINGIKNFTGVSTVFSSPTGANIIQYFRDSTTGNNRGAVSYNASSDSISINKYNAAGGLESSVGLYNNRLQIGGGITIAGNGSGLSALNASALATGTVPDARLSNNVVVSGDNQTIAGAKTFSSVVNAPGFNATSASQGFWGIAADSATNPSFSWTGYGNTGMWKTPNGIGFSIAGTNRIQITENGISGVGTGLLELNADQLTTGSVPTNRLANVRNAIAEHLAGQVGTYILAQINGNGSRNAILPGATVAGSRLRPASVKGAVLSGAGSLSGTWRCMGSCEDHNGWGGDRTRESTLWLRIS